MCQKSVLRYTCCGKTITQDFSACEDLLLTESCHRANIVKQSWASWLQNCGTEHDAALGYYSDMGDYEDSSGSEVEDDGSDNEGQIEGQSHQTMEQSGIENHKKASVLPEELEDEVEFSADYSDVPLEPQDYPLPPSPGDGSVVSESSAYDTLTTSPSDETSEFDDGSEEDSDDEGEDNGPRPGLRSIQRALAHITTLYYLLSLRDYYDNYPSGAPSGHSSLETESNNPSPSSESEAGGQQRL